MNADETRALSSDELESLAALRQASAAAPA